MSGTSSCSLAQRIRDRGGRLGMCAPGRPELDTPMVATRGSAPSVIARTPPHDWPMTAITPHLDLAVERRARARVLPIRPVDGSLEVLGGGFDGAARPLPGLPPS